MDLGLDCQQCDDTLKKERGCEGRGILPFEIDGERHFRCPIKLITPLSWEYIRAFNFFKRGFLPNDKSWLDESQKFLDAMGIIENEATKIEKEKLKKNKRKNA